MTLEELKQDYHKMSKEDKIAILKQATDIAIIEYFFYDTDVDIRLEVVQNERLPLGKLKRLARDNNQEIREIAIAMYERRLIY